MNETIQISELAIQVTRKGIKNVHLSVHPPDDRVTLVAPTATRLVAEEVVDGFKQAGLQKWQKMSDRLQFVEPGAPSLASAPLPKE